MNLTLAQLTADFARIHAHGLAETNVTEIQHTPGGGILFSVDASELEAQLEEAETSEARLEAELKTAEEERDRLDVENEKLVNMHEEFKDPESGITPATYKQQTEEALKSRDLYRQAMTEAREERDALRKRKGVTCELFKHEQEILAAIAYASTYYAEPDKWRPRFAALLAKLHTP